ncbi:NAD-dependent epimerase/dehydratase family protein [candidate division KSB1 bacterium]|nr:NAD-dependent epimerase/dehydratase family protein [candidate division KSB1 bacterium]NIR68515.1 NAD-dependent epimerase/dehydratase family protein [candidate division KSB1 bacterium]NIS22529.1 NAD-dependent epimerase/dehydratase family protein [candidate division KSB1 bacterium]NIT69373.1 NAD-dependent epimerase/dehydratase family protein [candidate division KSB1 bacterium]NIU23034.1 NAD-dependent epimerase/dehydratase family protein [candidate division KSB1 bacterium]
MRIFVSGGSGYIGSVVTETLAIYGHDITGLLRSPSKAGVLEQAGARPLLGDLNDPDTYSSALGQNDVLIHMAYQHQAETVTVDEAALQTFLDSAKLNSQTRMVIYTSGCHVLGDTGGERVAEDGSTDRPGANVTWRPEHEQRVLEAANERLTTAVIRPGMVYGGRGGLIPKMFESAKKDGTVTVFGDGENHWSMVHVEDLANLYRLIVEQEAGGIFHGVDGNPVKARHVAEAASEVAGAGGAINNIPLDEGRKKLGKLADALCLDQLCVARRSLQLGWQPERKSFLENVIATYREWKDKPKP